MEQTKAELKATLLAAMEAEMDELLRWEEETKQVTITDIEDQVLAARQRMSERLAESLAQRRAKRIDAAGLGEAGVGRKLHYKGKKTKSAKRGVG